MGNKNMQPILYMVALTWAAVFTIFAFGLFIIGKLNQSGLISVLMIGIIGAAGVAFGVKKVWFDKTGAGIQTGLGDIDEFVKDKIEQIDKDVDLHKESITALLKEANETADGLSENEQSINALITKAEQVEADLQKAIEMAAPPTFIPLPC